MHLIKYDNFWNDPFAEIDRVFERSFGNNRWANAFEPAASRSFRVDVYDDGKDAYEVVAELPGVEKQDVSIELENAVLTITAKRKFKQGDQEQTAEYSRSLTIADDIDSEKVTARLEDGILQVTLPKAEVSKPKAITVS